MELTDYMDSPSRCHFINFKEREVAVNILTPGSFLSLARKPFNFSCNTLYVFFPSLALPSFIHSFFLCHFSSSNAVYPKYV